MVKQETHTKFHQKVFNSTVVGVFNFSDKMPGFSKTIHLSRFLYEFCITELVF